MKFALLLISDGREPELTKCCTSVWDMVPSVINHFIHVDDASRTLGMAGALAEGWRRVLGTDADFVFHVEQDFIFDHIVPLVPMAELLIDRPYLTQVSLKRQPVNQSEIDAGGIVELDPDAFTEHNDGHVWWTEHRRYWTTNPGVYRADLCKRGWPIVEFSEGTFTHQLFQDPGVRCAIWGRKFDPPRITHIGKRLGHGY